LFIQQSRPAQKCATTINAAPTNIAGWQRPEFEQKPDKEHVLFNLGSAAAFTTPSGRPETDRTD
ncbi:hypothetical protein, partial [Escherichia coli]|uniref:hypothetical protein n=1 Tax=Escherichia coli TaxID=562 RepID=UPI000647D561